MHFLVLIRYMQCIQIFLVYQFPLAWLSQYDTSKLSTPTGFVVFNLTSKGSPLCITTCFKKIFIALETGIPNYSSTDSACAFNSESILIFIFDAFDISTPPFHLKQLQHNVRTMATRRLTKRAPLSKHSFANLVCTEQIIAYSFQTIFFLTIKATPDNTINPMRIPIGVLSPVTGDPF